MRDLILSPTREERGISRSREDFVDYREIAKKIVRVMDEKKAEDIVVLDLRDITTIADYFVICTGSSTTQVKAIVDDIIRELRGERLGEHVEASGDMSWVLIDCGGAVAHIFNPEKRAFYNLERFWGDAKQVDCSNIME
ncbi:MAG: ribosome silencing factor [bacterium]